MTLLRYTLHPHSSWQSPWEADMLWGRLACEYARRHGHMKMRADLQDPALAGEPPWVLSDAFPGDLLPLPAFVRQMDVAPTLRKRLKSIRWIPRDMFRSLQREPDELPQGFMECAGLEGFHTSDRWHNSISRESGTTGGDDENDGPGQLYVKTDTWPAPESGGALTLYARVADDGAKALLTDLLQALGETGYGADARTGRGAFTISGPEPDAELDDVPQPGGCVVLSSFQPSVNDPVDGCWEVVVKHGKVAADVLPGAIGFKHPMTLLRPGASFSSCMGQTGHALRMDHWLSAAGSQELRARDMELAHFLFGLAVPVKGIGQRHISPHA